MAAAHVARVPPYVSYKTFRTLVDDLHVNGVPQRIDRSVLGRFSGGVGTQLMSALRAMRLVNEEDEPTDALRSLVGAYETERWHSALRKVLESTYGFLMNQELRTITPNMLADAFRAKFQAKDDVLRKCQTFFLHAARDAHVELSARVLKKTRQRGGAQRRRGPAKPPLPDQGGSDEAAAASSAAAGEEAKGNARPSEPHSPYEMLLGILDPFKMDEREQDAVWTLIRYLKRREALE